MDPGFRRDDEQQRMRALANHESPITNHESRPQYVRAFGGTISTSLLKVYMCTGR
jgi:hypothetical protein